MTTGPLPEPTALARGEVPRLVLLLANLFWTVLCLGGYRPETLLVTSLLTAALVIGHLLLPTAGPRSHPAAGLFLPFVVYAAVNVVVVSPVAWLGWRDWFTWVQPLAFFWVVLTGCASRAARRWLIAALGLLASTASALACYQHFGHPEWIMLGRTQDHNFIGRASGPFGIPNSLGALLILILPTLIYRAWSRSRPAWSRAGFAAAALLSILGIVFSISRGAWLGLALALVIWPLCFGQGKLPMRLLAAAAVVAGVFGLVAVLVTRVPLVHDRLAGLVRDMGEHSRPILWRGAWGIFRQHPVWGGGASSFDVRFEAFRPEGFIDDPQWAHNDYLNTLCDYGAVGFVLAAAGLIGCAWRLRGVRGLEASLAIGLIAFLFQLFVDFHFKIPGLGLAFAVVAGLAVRGAWPAREGGAPMPAPLRWGAAVLIAGGVAFCVVPRIRAETLRYHARERIDRWSVTGEDLTRKTAELAAVVGDLQAAVRLDPDNGQAWSDLAFALSLEALGKPDQTVALGEEAAKAAERAVRLCPLNPEFWDRLCVGRDMARRWEEGGNAAAKALVLAPAQPAAWYYQGYHLGLSSLAQAEAVAALDVCLRLDPGNRAAQSLRQRLANGPPSASP